MQLTLREVAAFLKVPEAAVHRWVSSGEIPVNVVNGQYRFNRTELLEWATTRNLTVETAIFRDSPGASFLPALSTCLQSGGIFHDVPGCDKESILRRMIDTLALPASIDRDMLHQILVAREQMGTTAVGKGIAIPHVRHAIVLAGTAPLLSLWFLQKPVEFGASDGQPVHTLFFLMAPTVKVHMHLLSRLASLLGDPGFAAVLERRGTSEEILHAIHCVEDPDGTSGAEN